MDERKGPREGEAGAQDGVGPPVPGEEKWLGTVGKTMIAVGLGGIAFFTIIGAGSHRTMGAPASARLELERRRAEIERAVDEAGRLSACVRQHAQAGERAVAEEEIPDAERPRE